MNKNRKWIIGLLMMCGCASYQRDCNSSISSSFGADWIVLQYGFDGKPINCWKLNGAAITNEKASDGIYWESPSGNLVHISGWYNRVQVFHNDYTGAAKQLGIDIAACGEGAYKPVAPKP